MAVFQQLNGVHMGVRAQTVSVSTHNQVSTYVVNKPEIHERARTLYAHDSPVTNVPGCTFELMQVSFESDCGQVDISRGVHTCFTSCMTLCALAA